MTVGNRGDWRGASQRHVLTDYSHNESMDGTWEIDLSTQAGGYIISAEAPATATMVFGGIHCPNGLHVHYDGAGPAALRGIVWPIHNADSDFTVEMEAELHPYQTSFQILGLCLLDNLTPSNTLLMWMLGNHSSYGAPPWGMEHGAGFGTTVVDASNNTSSLGTRGWGAISRIATGYTPGVSKDGRGWTYRGGVTFASLAFTPRFFGPCWYDNVAVPKDYFVHRLRQRNGQYGGTTSINTPGFYPGMGGQVDLLSDVSR